SKRDWSSDVCSSDLGEHLERLAVAVLRDVELRQGDYGPFVGRFEFERLEQGRLVALIDQSRHLLLLGAGTEAIDKTANEILALRSEERRGGNEHQPQ